jgi:Rieske 2Fe-2S family protein
MMGDPTRFLLPPAAYFDEDWFDREQHSVFTRQWSLVAHVEQLAAPGDWQAARAGVAPVLVVRQPDGRLRAFHNLCRHRGMMLLDGHGNHDEIRCAYHGWRFDLDGCLRVVPQRRTEFPDLDDAACGLLPASVDMWEGMVFVHPDPAASPLTDHLTGLDEAIGSHRPGRLTLVATEDIAAECNWKLLVENHIDVYHLWHLHRESLGDFDHSRFEHRHVGRNWFSYEPLRGVAETRVCRAGVDGQAAVVASNPDRSGLERGTATISHLADRERLGIEAHLVFPNLLIAATAEFFMTYAVVPDAPTRAHIEVRVRAEPCADGAALLRAAHSFVDEDVYACEHIQSGIRSPWFSVGPISRTHEAPIMTFHRDVLEALDAGASEAPG